MSKRSISTSESSSKAHKRHPIATSDEEDRPSPASMLGHSSSVPMIQTPLHLIARLILPFIKDRATWNSVCLSSKELYLAGKDMTPPWPKTTLHFEGNAVDGAVAFSPSGSHLAFGTDRAIVHVLDRWGKETLLHGNTGNMSCLGYSSDGAYLASGTIVGQGGSIRLWRTESFHATSTSTSSETTTTIPLAQPADSSILLGNHSTVAVLAFSRTDSNLLASAGWNGEIKLWNVKEQACIYTFFTHAANSIPSLLFAGGDRSVCNAVLSTGAMIRLWRAESSSEFTTETIDIPAGDPPEDRDRADHDGTITPRTAFSPCGSFLMIATSSPLRVEYGTKITFYELETMIKSQSVFIAGFASLCSGVSPDSKTLVLGDLQGRILLLQRDNLPGIRRDIDTRRLPPTNAPLWYITVDPTCRVLAFGRQDGRFELWTL
jgi:WD40 repeat protein